mmetsp:Transcript_9818/g.30053  ORF Transcript_9818/g.30053 Transcript_9818/m.30053 type:complete len:303 (-) Transcript_9818:1157-2065(-)
MMPSKPLMAASILSASAWDDMSGMSSAVSAVGGASLSFFGGAGGAASPPRFRPTLTVVSEVAWMVMRSGEPLPAAAATAGACSGASCSPESSSALLPPASPASPKPKASIRSSAVASPPFTSTSSGSNLNMPPARRFSVALKPAFETASIIWSEVGKPGEPTILAVFFVKSMVTEIIPCSALMAASTLSASAWLFMFSMSRAVSAVGGASLSFLPASAAGAAAALAGFFFSLGGAVLSHSRLARRSACRAGQSSVVAGALNPSLAKEASASGACESFIDLGFTGAAPAPPFFLPFLERRAAK